MNQFNFVAYSDRVRDTACSIKLDVTSGARYAPEHYRALYIELLKALPHDWQASFDVQADSVQDMVRHVERELLNSGHRPDRIESFSALLRLGLFIQQIEANIQNWRPVH